MNQEKLVDNNASAVIAAARRAVDIKDRFALVNINNAVLPLITNESGHVEVQTHALNIIEQAAPTPRRVIGTATHEDLASFIVHVNRQKQGESVIFASVGDCRLTAIVNYHGASKQPAPATENVCATTGYAAEQPAWADHKIVYQAKTSREWDLWTANSGKWLEPGVFADLVEFNGADLATGDKSEGFPRPADLVSLARNLRVEKRVFTRRVQNPTTGECHLEFKEENTADAASGSTKIPQKFLLGIPVFEGDEEAVALECWLRIKTQEGGKIMISFEIPDRDRAKRAAFTKTRKSAHEGTGLPVFAGTPEK